ncbi:MAG: hypothetical protein GTN69_10575 [Armatimonadetes bacterium]|nr:hypothetical protein [Armatimonadota bacterium]
MARKQAIVVETLYLKPPTRNPGGSFTKHKPKKITPPPVPHVLGSHGSDEARAEVKQKHRALGYNVTYVGFTDAGILVHVSNEEPKKRKPRSATRRLRR